MAENLDGVGNPGGWDPSQFPGQWSAEQFDAGDLSFTSQEASQYPDFDGLYGQQPDSLPAAQGWPQQQDDYYAGHQNPIGSFGYAPDQRASYAAPQAQATPTTWQSYQPAQNGYSSPSHYSNPLAANHTLSPSPYAQQAHFVPSEPAAAPNQVPGNPASQQANGYGYGINAHQPAQQQHSPPHPQQQALQQQAFQHQALQRQQVQQQAIHQQALQQPSLHQHHSIHQQPLQQQALQKQPLQKQPPQQPLAQQQQQQPIQQQLAQQQQQQQQPIQPQLAQQQQQQPIQQQTFQKQQTTQYAPSQTHVAHAPDSVSNEANLQRIAATRKQAGSVPATSSIPAPIPPPVARPASVPAATPLAHPVAAPNRGVGDTSAVASGLATAVAGIPNFAPSNANEADRPTLREESKLREDAKALGLIWPGVANLVMGDTEVQLVRPAMRYTTTVLKGDQSLYKKLPSGPMLAEVLGRHLEAYLKDPPNPEHDHVRRQADALLDVELRRINKVNERPKDWYSRAIPGEGKKREIPGWETYSAKNNDSKPDYRRVEPPATEDMVIEAELFLPPALNNHAEYVKKVLDDYSARIRGAVTILKETPAYSELKNAVRMRKKDPQSVKGDGIAKMREQLREPSDKLRRIIKYGLDLPDSTFLQRLGSENLVTTAVLNVLVNLNNQDEGNSSLAKTILKLLCRFTTLTPFLLEGKYKLEGAKVKLLRERGDDEVNQLLDDLLAMVEKNKDKDGSPRQIAKPADQKGAKTGSPSKKSDGTTGAVRSASATKRPREEDAEVRTSKKLATGATKSSSSPALSGPAATKPAPAAARSSSTSLAAKLAVKKSPATSSTATAKPAAGVLPGKRAPVKPAPRTDSPTSDPPKPAVKPEPAPKMDFSKLEITKPGSKPAAGSSSTSSSLTGNKPPVVKKAPAPPPSGKSKFASLLDEINDPKTETRRGPVLPADPAKEETEEEKKRRLRKEERRRQNLRVTFKSDDRLVEVREFERHEDEEPGDFMTWGIDNSESKTDEGRALRESHLSNIRSYEDLIPIDFPSSLATAARGEAYTTRGGPKQFRTAEQAFMEDRDSKVLSVVYTSKEDIPPTPKSPTLASSGPASTQQPEQWPLPTGAPLLDEMHRRHKDFQQQGLRKAAEHALHRQANPVFGDYQNVMEKVDAVIRQNQNMALPAERPTQPTPVTAHPPPQAPTTATAADPDRRPIDANNLSAYLQKMMAVDWNASGMEMARGNAVADMLTNIPWNSIPKSSLPYSVNDPYDPAKATTQRRHDYANPEVQKSADTLENFVAQFNRDRPLEMQNRVIAEIRSQAHAETEAKAQAQAQAKAMEEAARAAVLQAEQAQAQPSREDHAAAWVRYWQENPQAAGAFYQQQQEQQQLRQQQEQEQQQQLQQQQQQQQMQQQQQQQNAGVQAVLAQLQLGTHQAAPAVASSAMMRGGSAEGYGGHAGHGQQAASTGRGQNRSHGGRRNRGSGGAAGTDEGEDSEPSRAVNPSKVGTKQCSFWLKGKCAKGDRCTYRHA